MLCGAPPGPLLPRAGGRHWPLHKSMKETGIRASWPRSPSFKPGILCLQHAKCQNLPCPLCLQPGSSSLQHAASVQEGGVLGCALCFSLLNKRIVINTPFITSVTFGKIEQRENVALEFKWMENPCAFCRKVVKLWHC
jgi:hypothetical protein